MIHCCLKKVIDFTFQWTRHIFMSFSSCFSLKLRAGLIALNVVFLTVIWPLSVPFVRSDFWFGCRLFKKIVYVRNTNTEISVAIPVHHRAAAAVDQAPVDWCANESSQHLPHRVFWMLLLFFGVETYPGPSTCILTPRNIIIANLDAQSAVNKAAELHLVIVKEKLDILTVNKSWFYHDAPNALYDDVAPSGYSIFNAPLRDGHRIGGVTFVYGNTMKVSHLPVNETFSL